MKKFISIIFAALLVTQAGCLKDMIKDSAKDTPLNNRILLHKNPRVGDYAIFQGAQGAAQVKMKIIGRSGKLFIIRSESGFVIPGVGFKESMTIDVYATWGGFVKKGFLVVGDERTPLKVAAPGQNEYMMPVNITADQKRKFGLGNSVTVKAGNFRVSLKAFKSRKSDRDTIVVYQISPQVKFMHVAGYSFLKNGSEYEKHPALELIEQGNKR